MAAKAQTATVEAEIPVRLLGEMQSLIEAGWFRNLDELILEAIRRYIESRGGELMEQLIREDVKWGLRGSAPGSSRSS